MPDYRVTHSVVEVAHPKGQPFTQEFKQGDVISEDDQKEFGFNKRELDRLVGHGALEEIEEYKPKRKSRAKTAKATENTTDVTEEDAEDDELTSEEDAEEEE